MRRSRLLLAAMLVVVCAVFLTGCGDSTSGNVDVVLVDTSKSFCPALPNCQNKIDAAVDDNLADLSKHGGSLRLLLIGSDTGAPVVASSNRPLHRRLARRGSVLPEAIALGEHLRPVGNAKKGRAREDRGRHQHGHREAPALRHLDHRRDQRGAALPA